MNDRTKQVIDFNASDRQQVAVQPNAELVLTGIDFDDVAVDIIDTDVILSNPETGDRLVLLGLALYLFDEEEAPLLSFEGEQVSPNLLLSKVGAIDNLTMQEFVAVSSLLADTFKRSDEEKAEEDEESEALLPSVHFPLTDAAAKNQDKMMPLLLHLLSVAQTIHHHFYTLSVQAVKALRLHIHL